MFRIWIINTLSYVYNINTTYNLFHSFLFSLSWHDRSPFPLFSVLRQDPSIMRIMMTNPINADECQKVCATPSFTFRSLSRLKSTVKRSFRRKSSDRRTTVLRGMQPKAGTYFSVRDAVDECFLVLILDAMGVMHRFLHRFPNGRKYLGLIATVKGILDI